MSLALFDINFLIALAWPNHQFHSITSDWFARNRNQDWATCTVTQLGFIRLSSNRSYLQNTEKTPEEARLLLAELISQPRHRFLSDAPAPISLTEVSRIMGHQQLTDAYLLGVARVSRAKLVTFDRRLAALADKQSLVEVLGPTI
jgi:toxin-antitoxin system PIN domain toxin